MVDLDLDVVRRWDVSGHIYDEDEFAEHQVELHYPPDVVVRAERDCADVAASIRANNEPYANVGQAWLDHFIATQSTA